MFSSVYTHMFRCLFCLFFFSPGPLNFLRDRRKEKGGRQCRSEVEVAAVVCKSEHKLARVGGVGSENGCTGWGGCDR